MNVYFPKKIKDTSVKKLLKRNFQRFTPFPKKCLQGLNYTATL